MITLTTFNPISSLRRFVARGAHHVVSLRCKHPLRRGCDLVTLDALSAKCRCPIQRHKFKLLDHRASWAAYTLLHPKTHNKHSDVGDKAAYT